MRPRCPPPGEGRADGTPERGQQRVGVGAARARVAEDDDQQDGQADADDAQQGLAGQGGGAHREHDQGAQPQSPKKVPGRAPRTGPTMIALTSPATIAYRASAASRMTARCPLEGRAPALIARIAAHR